MYIQNCQLILTAPLSIPFKNCKFESHIVPGNMIKVIAKQIVRPVRKGHATRKLFFIIIKNATNSDLYFPD